MFVQDPDSKLVFVKSNNIKVFPCGRRRSAPIDADDNPDTVSDQHHIPFDPEARLNTEANNRKHSGLNGYKQNYINYWRSDGKISLVLAGYLFDLDTAYTGSQYINSFGNDIETLLGTEISSIYVNIKLANIEFFQGSLDGLVAAASTKILRDQSTNIAPATCLDFLIAGANKSKIDSYYFSGLSFSAVDLTASDFDFISMPILDKVNGVWTIHNASKLPRIEHGNTKDSIVIPGNVEITDNLTVNTINTTNILIGRTPETANPAASLKVVPLENNTYQLQFFA
jgi:hypothetical protein